MAITSLTHIQDAKRIVIKIGSSLLVEGGALRMAWLETVAQDVAALRRRGAEIVIVSSGAIALGASQLGFSRGGRATLADAQAAASVGQVALARAWAEMLSGQGLVAAQMLLTLDDLEDRRRYLNASATMERLIGAGAVPIINENDSVATTEIRFGDNDRLAARMAQVAGASAVVLLSDVDGLYDRNPAEEGAKLVPVVAQITPEIMAMGSSASSSGMGSGGMVSKLQAAQIAERAGTVLAIINGMQAHPLSRAFAQNMGTIFLSSRNDVARKAWLGGRLAPSGSVRVDAGCAAALQKGASLLAAGIVGVSGQFRRGDLVAIISMKGEKLAQGLAEYSSVECMAIAGLREDAQEERLGYAPRSAVIHRNHMVML